MGTPRVNISTRWILKSIDMAYKKGKAMIRFETGIIDPRNGHFDHHGQIAHSDAFIAKMASVQLIESLIIKDEIGSFSTDTVELNHVGHLDDMVLHAIPSARDNGKVRSLYAFACRVSALDSLGPAANRLLQDDDRKIVNEIYDTFQNKVSEISAELGIDRFKIDLQDRVSASRLAGERLVELLASDSYTEPEVWVPNPEQYTMLKFEDDVAVIRIEDSSCNPLRASAYFYAQGVKVLIAFRSDEDLHTYTVCARSAYDVDLTPLWNKLTELEQTLADPIPEGSAWGGHSGAGGSPRGSTPEYKGGSKLHWSVVLQEVGTLVAV